VFHIFLTMIETGHIIWIADLFTCPVMYDDKTIKDF